MVNLPSWLVDEGIRQQAVKSVFRFSRDVGSIIPNHQFSLASNLPCKNYSVYNNKLNYLSHLTRPSFADNSGQY
jgi:hypothetical protein